MMHITLQVLDGADRGRVFADVPTPITIGREEGNVIQLNDERISRFHLKIQEDQEHVVLTDLESTNGTRVNGEETGLRILRYGDMIAVGRTVLVYGSRNQIAGRLAALRKQQGGNDKGEVDVNFAHYPPAGISLNSVEPPALPVGLSPAQAAQVGDVLGYFHTRVRQLMNTAREPDPESITLNLEEWQSLLDLQAQLAVYLREIGGPAK